MDKTTGCGTRQSIPPVDERQLERAAQPGAVPDASSLQLREAEFEYLRRWRSRRGKSEEFSAQDLMGMALSGGGIRSATFSLGVMQALAHRDLLREVDYLSTVSGGGYIGASLTWLTSSVAESAYRGEGQARPQPGVERGNFPFGTDDPDPGVPRHPPRGQADGPLADAVWQRRVLEFLRHHGFYLTPGEGIDALSLLGVVLRGSLLNLLVWIPLLIFLFLYGALLIGQLQQLLTGLHPALAWLLETPPLLERAFEALLPAPPCTVLEEGVTRVVNAGSYCAEQQFRGFMEEILAGRLTTLWGFELFLWVGLVMLLALFLGTLAYSFLTWKKYDLSPLRQAQWYQMRRRAEHESSLGLALMVAFLAVGTLPIVAISLHGWAEAAGPLAIFTGMGLAIRQFLATARNGTRQVPGILVSVAAGLFLYGVVIVAFLAAFQLLPLASAGFGWRQAVLLVLLLLLPLAIGWFTNLNYISIHRYYRDRLMETFMPDLETALGDRTGKAAGANDTKLHQVERIADPRAPYHIVNTNVILVDSDKRKYRARGGDNFILSPLYCGSNATGWSPTCRFMRGKMTLATAMAISGAAVNPNTGVGGKGPTRSRSLSLLMSLLNLRLGYWADNPRHHPAHLPNHFLPGIYAFGSILDQAWAGLNEGRRFVELSDGGHFENMALYELVRRRVGLIIVCDGGADPAFSFSDFQTTVRRIEDDFGARVVMYSGATPDDLMPEPGSDSDSRYPADARFSRQGHMVGRVLYADGSRGFLLYLKTTLIKEVSFKVKGYAALNPDFPDQTTSDQFFDEVQFEAYRALGYRLAMQMLDDKVPADAVSELEAAYGRRMARDGASNEALIRFCCGRRNDKIPEQDGNK